MPPKRKASRKIVSDGNASDDDFAYEDDDKDEDYVDDAGKVDDDYVGEFKGKRDRRNKSFEEDDDDDESIEETTSKRSKSSSKKGKKAAKSNGRLGSSAPADAAVQMQDYSESLVLKPDHTKRPIWITGDNKIILESFSHLYKRAYDFLIDIAEPVARPEFFQSYQLTEDSLYSAVAVSRKTDDIIKHLKILCKTNVPESVIAYVENKTRTFGKAKLVLKDNVFHVESEYPDVLRDLLRYPDIRNARLHLEGPSDTEVVDEGGLGAKSSRSASGLKGDDAFVESAVSMEDRRNVELIRLDNEEDEDDDYDMGGEQKIRTFSFQIASEKVQVFLSAKF